MRFGIIKTALLAISLLFAIPSGAFAQVSDFEDGFRVVAGNCATPPEAWAGVANERCISEVLANISAARNASSDAQFNFELTVLSTAFVTAWDVSTPQSACIRLANALVEVSLSTSDAILGQNILSVSEVVRQCGPLGIDIDRLLASPN